MVSRDAGLQTPDQIQVVRHVIISIRRVERRGHNQFEIESRELIVGKFEVGAQHADNRVR